MPLDAPRKPLLNLPEMRRRPFSRLDAKVLTAALGSPDPLTVMLP
jgi:hypothetical protein